MILKILFKIGEYLDILTKVFACVCLSVMSTVMMAEVIARNVYMSLGWAEEVSATFFGTWFIFVGAAIVTRKSQMVAVTFFRDHLPRKIVNKVTFASEIFGLIFLSVGIVYGIMLVKQTLTQPSATLMIPMGYAYLGVPVGCSIIFYQTVLLMIQGKPLSEYPTEVPGSAPSASLIT